MEIKCSSDFSAVDTELLRQISVITNQSVAFQARKMLRNFKPMIAKLGQLEVEARRKPYERSLRVEEQLDYINRELHNFEDWLMFLVLS
jgi:hypothetical protein